MGRTIGRVIRKPIPDYMQYESQVIVIEGKEEKKEFEKRAEMPLKPGRAYEVIEKVLFLGNCYNFKDYWNGFGAFSLFDGSVKSTIGIVVNKKIFRLPEYNAAVTLLMWDVDKKGTKRMGYKAWRQGADGAVIMGDMTSNDYCDDIKESLTMIEKDVARDFITIVGGRAEELSPKEYAKAEEIIEDMAKTFGTAYFMTKRIGDDEPFRMTARRIARKVVSESE